jgi:hypothetical protein
MKRRKRGNFVFFIPIIVVGSLILFAYLHALATKNPELGVLVVRAQVQKSYAGSNQTLDIQVTFTLNGKTYTTPENLSLPAGNYSVIFQEKKGFQKPQSCTISIVPGYTTYCIASYIPIPQVINIFNGRFDQNKVFAYSGITSIIWVNKSGNSTVLYIEPIGRIILLPNQQFSYVFESDGIYYFRSLSFVASGEIDVFKLN